ncbi:MAG TPA: hypothetical protein VGZ00_05160 [Candidatus Baltobacteraceae bacterium]|jgi:hypothetical protein|nr:hypothetical protein [Candidatus Baltobacteraceae bacterium]
MIDAEPWESILPIANRIGTEFPDAVFLGGLAAYAHAVRLGVRWPARSHDDMACYLSINGKTAMRDRYGMQDSPDLTKSSVRIAETSVDVYSEEQPNVAIPYPQVAAHSHPCKGGLRVASLEHMFVLATDAALTRSGTEKENAMRDLLRIVPLWSKSKNESIAPFFTPESHRGAILLHLADNAKKYLRTMNFDPEEAELRQKQFAKVVNGLIESTELETSIKHHKPRSHSRRQ